MHCNFWLTGGAQCLSSLRFGSGPSCWLGWRWLATYFVAGREPRAPHPRWMDRGRGGPRLPLSLLLLREDGTKMINKLTISLHALVEQPKFEVERGDEDVPMLEL